MVDFSKYLSTKANAHEAAVAFLKSLRQKGVHVDPHAVPKFAVFGLDGKPSTDVQHMVERIMTEDFEHADDLVAQLGDAGYFIDYGALIRDPTIYARNIDHERTLAHIRGKMSTDTLTPPMEAEMYLNHLAVHNIKLSRERKMARLLPQDYHSLLLNPNFIINVAIRTGNILSRCKPGYSDFHSDRSRFMLADHFFYEDRGRVLENMAIERGVKISDGICEDCYPLYLRRVEEDLKALQPREN